MKRRLMDVLCCPHCEGPFGLHVIDASGDEIVSGELKCTDCAAAYPILRGVPRFVSGDQYAGNFSLEWSLHRRTQLDSATGLTESADAFDAKCGLHSADLDGKLTLDVGCGTGRFAEIAADRGAEVVGIDLSFAVDSAYENLGLRPGIHIVQASVFELPFRRDVFDVAYSLGVLHHTPDTREAFRAFLPHVRPGGAVAIWVYWVGMVGRASDALRFVTTRISDKTLYGLCKKWVPWLRARESDNRAVRGLLSRVPISRSRDMDEAILDTFDWYSPKYQWRHDWAEVENWFSEADLVDVRRNEYPVAVRGRKR